MYSYKLSAYLVFCCGICFLLQSVTVARPVVQSEGQRLFQIHCAVCHGRKGEGGLGPTLAAPKLVRASTYKSLIEIITDGIPGTQMPGSDLQGVQIRQVAAYIRQIGRQPVELVSGDPRRGEQLYWTKGGCRQCHVLRGQGIAIGPDLTSIGARRSASYLRTSLLDPEADVPQGVSTYREEVSIPTNFLQVRIRTKDDRIIAGVRVNEDTFSIQIRDLAGNTYSFAKSELVELDKQWRKSPMPSYRGIFSNKEVDDMTAFLASLRGER